MPDTKRCKASGRSRDQRSSALPQHAARRLPAMSSSRIAVRRFLRPMSSVAFAAASACAVFAGGAAAAATADSCVAQSGPQVPTVVELYTSEGCNSCPPADRWLTGLRARDGVVPLAFHVDYWDSLGWKDRFAQPQFTQRQNASQRTSGARFAYTPQVIVDGRDTPNWSVVPTASLLAARAPSTVALRLERDGTALRLVVSPGTDAPATLGGFVAVVDDGNLTHVGAGENRGVTLRQDGVVRELLPWTAAHGQPTTLSFTPTSSPEAGATRHWVAVATDAATGKPLQAVTLACAR